MNLAVISHIYPANPLSPTDIPASFLPPFLHELARLGTQVHVLAPQGYETQVADELAPVTRYNWWRDKRPIGKFQLTNPLDTARLISLISNGIRELNALVAREPIDAVLACWAIPSGFIASFAAPRKPYAVWGLGTDIHTSARHPLMRPFVRRALASASIRYANSNALVQQIEQLGLDCNLLTNIRPLPLDVPRADFPNDRANFLVAARFERVKGIDILLDALAQMPAPRPRIYLAGNGTLESDLRAQAANLGLQNDVVFLGFLDERAMASALRACDAVVIPSRDESIPMIFKEAARFGTPVVATDVGDLGNFVREYNAGVVVPPNDARALANGMTTFLNTPRENYRARLGEIAAQFDITRSAEKLLNDLKKMAE